MHTHGMAFFTIAGANNTAMLRTGATVAHIMMHPTAYGGCARVYVHNIVSTAPTLTNLLTKEKPQNPLNSRAFEKKMRGFALTQEQRSPHISYLLLHFEDGHNTEPQNPAAVATAEAPQPAPEGSTWGYTQV